VKALEPYYAQLDAGCLPVMRGFVLDEDDRLRRDVIQRLMCDFVLDFEAIDAAHGIRFEQRFADELAAMRPLADDGLVELEPRRLGVTARGRLLVRTVAMQFDRHLQMARERTRYSRVI